MASTNDRPIALTLTLLTLLGGLLTTALTAAHGAGMGKKPSTAGIAAGKAVFEQNKCASCHMIAGKGGKSGPDLSAEGANARHTSQWLETEIKNPKSHKADSFMPAYDGKIKGKDLTNLVAYLGSLKKK